MADDILSPVTTAIATAISEPIRALGGDALTIQELSFAAAYALVCWSVLGGASHGMVHEA